jgi:hypothetical protein
VEFSELIEELEARLMASPSPDTFSRYAPEVFSTVLQDRLHVKVMNELLSGIRDRNMPITALNTSGEFIALHTSAYCSWAIIFHKVRARFLYLSPVDALQARVGGAELFVTRYSCEEPEAFDILQPDLELVSSETVQAALGEVFTRHGRREILDWQTGAGETRTGTTLRVNSGLRADFEWAVDRETRRPVGLSGMDPVNSNMTTIFSLLASIGDKSSIESLRPFLASDKHFMRWSAAKAIAAIDAEAGMESVTALVDDPHLEVRNAARKSLDRLVAAA